MSTGDRPVADGDTPDENEQATKAETEPEPDAEGTDPSGIVVEVEVEPDDGDEERAERIAQLETQVKETYERLVRTTADFENFRKRSRREINDARVDEQSRVLREMLPVVDNLERALAAASDGGDGGDGASIRQGVELVLRQFVGSLERFSVARIDAKGKPFDPNLHEAVSQIETNESPPGTVVDVLQTGYTIGERLLRAALTVVAKAPTAPIVEGAPSVDVANESQSPPADEGAEVDEAEVVDEEHD